MAKGDRESISFRSRRSDLWTQINGPIEPGYSACSGSCINGVGTPTSRWLLESRMHNERCTSGCVSSQGWPVQRETAPPGQESGAP